MKYFKYFIEDKCYQKPEYLACNTYNQAVSLLNMSLGDKWFDLSEVSKSEYEFY